MIRYLGYRVTDDKIKYYIFLINGLRREVREHKLSQHPGCYKVLPQKIKDDIKKNRAWLAQVI